MEKLEKHCWYEQKWCSHFGKIWQFLKELNRVTGIILLGTHFKRNENISPHKKSVHKLLFIIVIICKQPKCSTMDKKYVVYPSMKCYFAIKRNKILMHATMCMNLENIMLIERNQSQKTTYYMIPFI